MSSESAWIIPCGDTLLASITTASLHTAVVCRRSRGRSRCQDSDYRVSACGLVGSAIMAVQEVLLGNATLLNSRFQNPLQFATLFKPRV